MSMQASRSIFVRAVRGRAPLTGFAAQWQVTSRRFKADSVKVPAPGVIQADDERGPAGEHVRAEMREEFIRTVTEDDAKSKSGKGPETKEVEAPSVAAYVLDYGVGAFLPFAIGCAAATGGQHQLLWAVAAGALGRGPALVLDKMAKGEDETMPLTVGAVVGALGGVFVGVCAYYAGYFGVRGASDMRLAATAVKGKDEEVPAEH